MVNIRDENKKDTLLKDILIDMMTDLSRLIQSQTDLGKEELYILTL